MGAITKFFVAILIVVLISSLFLGTLYDASTAPDKQEIIISTNIQSKIENSTSEIQTILAEDTQSDPNDPLSLANYFSKTLAILGEVVSIITSVFAASIDFVQSILLNIFSLPSPFNILGAFVAVGVSIFTIVIIFKAASIFFKFEL